MLKSLTALAIFFAAGVQTQGLSACAPLGASCTATEVTPTPRNALCGTRGSVRRPNYAQSPCTFSTFAQCRDSCLVLPGCISFSYDAATRECDLYKNSPSAQGFVPSAKSARKFYNRNCFAATCTTPTPPASPTTVLVTVTTTTVITDITTDVTTDVVSQVSTDLVTSVVTSVLPASTVITTVDVKPTYPTMPNSLGYDPFYIFSSDGSPNVGIALDQNNAHSGEWVGTVDFTVGGFDDIALETPALTFSANTNFIFSAWFKIIGPDKCGASLLAVDPSTRRVIGTEGYLYPIPSTYEQVSTNFNLGTQTSAVLVIEISCFSGGTSSTFYFDDINVTPA